jgi:hypothetical protein
LEKSSRNYKPFEEWAKPNLTPDVTPPPQAVLGHVFWRFCTWWVPGLALLKCHIEAPYRLAVRQGGGRGVNVSLYLINGLKENRPIQNEGSQWCAAPFMFTWLWSTGHRWSWASFGVFI